MMPQQTWNPDKYARHAGFVAELGGDLIEMLAPARGEMILDLGCGDGALTAKLLSLGCRVLAIDSSAEQVAAAAARNLDAQVVDAEAMTYEAAFEGVFSNAALHWMKRPEAVIDGVWRALRPAGRFVGEMGGARNVQAVVDAVTKVLGERGVDAAACNPWFFPDETTYRKLLQDQGFDVEFMQLFPRPTPLDGDIVHWLKLFTQSFVADVDESEHEGIYCAVSAQLETTLRDDDGNWFVDYVRLRFKAIKPAS
ncbi:MAG: methyltransferase domain-containing protein [Gammaproteobacteria bacterium]|nr:methyltransferase domain-containing protein [Gammaproteobacteria bacterium]